MPCALPVSLSVPIDLPLTRTTSRSQSRLAGDLLHPLPCSLTHTSSPLLPHPHSCVGCGAPRTSERVRFPLREKGEQKGFWTLRYAYGEWSGIHYFIYIYIYRYIYGACEREREKWRHVMKAWGETGQLPGNLSAQLVSFLLLFSVVTINKMWNCVQGYGRGKAMPSM